MGEHPRILIIEDDAFFREFLLRTLDRDYRIQTAEDGMQALTTLSLHHVYDVILCDLRMPGFSGRELIQRIRQITDEDTELIIVTGFEQDWSPIEATDAQVFAYLKKGEFGPKDLRKVIQNAVAQRRRKQEARHEARQLQSVRKELESKVAEGSRALSESEAKYRQLFEQSLVGIYIQQEGRNRLAKDKLCEILGCRLITLERKSIEDFVVPAEIEGQPAVRNEGEAPQEPMREVKLKTSKGKIRNVLHCAGDIRFQGTTAIQGCMLDITEWKTMEQLVFQHQKMESLGTLISGINHEFNNILAAILPQTELLLQRAKEIPSIQRPVENLYNMACKASRLTRQLLNMSRQVAMEKRPLEVNNWIRESLSLLATTIGNSVALELALHPDAGRIEADPHHLDQILMNLVLNARDAMPEGGKIRISTSARNPQAPDRGSGKKAEAGLVEITVEDTGGGILPDHLDKIFEPFFTTKEAGKGTGLGLSVAYSLVKQHEGEILVSSKPGKGTTFRLLFPRLSAPSGKKSQAVHCGTVLVADTDPAMLNIFRDVLVKMKYEVIPAQNEEQAFEIYAHQKDDIDAVILAGRSGGPGSRDSCTRFLDLNPGIRMILTKLKSDEDFDLSVRSAGGRAADIRYLTLPATPEILSRSLREVLKPGNS